MTIRWPVVELLGSDERNSETHVSPPTSRCDLGLSPHLFKVRIRAFVVVPSGLQSSVVRSGPKPSFTGFLLALLFEPADGGDIILRNVELFKLQRVATQQVCTPYLTTICQHYIAE
jgi:hypothetical protein